ncbi:MULTISPECIES: glycosyltransferase family 9 protein [Micromonospora]|uniref:Glycosyltransferase family 9 protein n=1 Tax=Micromonospora chalcea TaxID=1874 RepID=A0ABX9Y9U1_MICCH|nr:MULTISPECIES: glycosyltransferase family 9 protein [Micromonospora]MBC8991209.1 glycosyltransferase family 9 protein [Micromonospora chalcea]MBQ1064820.1 glycosyltransferase family 9 protein [Micromonospora sp. C41]MCK1807784.1 glycosyltransferase family 9 protein [Micromonospora sp. R42106]MCK1832855.1 glycosyltransferase family 9 protein [Micromonospora sp. R42003]MCK1844283.1 glycosyltransferase family 9 protein [Micromonospora sp. R42004]
MILVLRALGVGDLVTAVPALRGLRAGLPGRELVLAAPDWLAPLAELTGAVDRVLPTTGPDRIAWTGPPPEVAVNLHGRGPQSHRALAAVRPGRLLAHRNPDAGHPDGPAWDDDEHEVRRWCRLLHAYGLPADPGDLALRRPAAGGVPAGLTLLHPGSKIPAKRWPARRFAGLARELTARGHRVAVTGSAGERALAERVARDGGLPPEAVLAGRTGLAELAALVAGARLVVSGDTGVAHLATGYGTASVVLFGPVPAAHWGPPADRPRHRALGAIEPTHVNPDSTGSRGVGSHPTLNAIGIDEVVAAVADVERVSGAVAA